MAFKITTESVPLPELVEMSAKFVQDDATSALKVSATLRIRPNEIDIGEEYVVTVRFKSAYLFLEPDNMKPDPDSYHGQRAHTQVMNETEYKTTATRSGSSSHLAGVEGEMGTSLKDGAGGKTAGRYGYGKERQAEISVERARKVVEQYIPVEYWNANSWKIAPHATDHLSGTYLQDDTLVSLSPDEGHPNKVGASLHLFVKRRDIEVLVEGKHVPEKGWLNTNSRNRETVLNALMTKRLRGACQQKSEQDVTFAHIEADDVA